MQNALALAGATGCSLALVGDPLPTGGVLIAEARLPRSGITRPGLDPGPPPARPAIG